MGKISSALFNGGSGEQYRFEVYDLNTFFRQGLAGVFVMARRYKLPDGNFTIDPLFIGEKEDLSLLVGYYPNQDCLTKHGVNCKCIYKVPDKNYRLYIVEDLLDFNETSCNH